MYVFCPQGFLSQLRLTLCSDQSLMYSSWFEIKYLQQQQQQHPLLKQIVKNVIITSFVLDHVRVDRFGEMYLNK